MIRRLGLIDWQLVQPEVAKFTRVLHQFEDALRNCMDAILFEPQALPRYGFAAADERRHVPTESMRSIA